MQFIDIKSRKAQNYVPDSSCDHIRSKKEEVMKSFEVLHSFYLGCVAEHWEKKAEDHICCKCRALVFDGKIDEMELLKQGNLRVHACLHCVYFGCYSRVTESGEYEFGCHIKDHSVEKDHPAAMDINSGQVLCLQCGDYKYDPDLMAIAEQHTSKAASKRRRLNTSSLGVPEKFEPSPELLSILEQHIVWRSAPVVRGLENVVQNCYLNVIIQCLMAAPLFRDYLLSYAHKCSNKNKKPCCICSVTDVAQKLLSEEKEPAFLAHFIHAFSERCPGFTIGQFQDAFEAYISLLNRFHEDVTADAPSALHDCQCAIHKMFQFHIKPKRCNNVNCRTANQPDILTWGIDVSYTGQSFKDSLSSILHEMEGDCDSCKAYAGCTDKYGPATLPYIMNFCISNISQGIDFEETLDMSPYIIQNWESSMDSKLEYKYYLFAVVEFMGKAGTGHYQSFVRKSQGWFQCNDTDTKPVTTETVLKVQARILFYHQNFL